MSSGGAGPLVPTFHGFVHNTMDGLVLFEACLSGKLHHVPRRPHDRERSSLIKSGSIFIYEENASGIKRWTDGVAWSPSRILGNFLIYRELEKPFPPGEKKRAIKRKRTTAPGEPYPRRDSDETDGAEIITPLTPPSPNPNGEAKSEMPGTDQDKELERSLIGSLVDSYGFRPDGLVKKTMSVSVNGISHHMVSYYKVEDVKNNVLPRPLSDPRLQSISVRPELYLKQNFRAPVEETEHYAIDGQMHAHPQAMYSSMMGGYGVRPGQYIGQPYTSIYGMQATTGASVYGAMTGTSWPTQQATMGALSYGNRGYDSQSYATNYYQPPTTSSAAPAVKTENQQATAPASGYNTQYASNYASMPRNDAQSTPMMQSAYHTPAQTAASSFGSMSAHNGRSSYGNIMNSPATRSQMLCCTVQGPAERTKAATNKLRSSITGLTTPRENIYNLPNLLTVSRILAAPATAYLLLHDQYPWALALFAYAGLTDLVDGWLARKWHLQTVAGSVIDPMADKALMIILTVTLAVKGAIPLYLATLILGRDASLALAAIYYRYASLPAPKTFVRYWDFSLPSAEVHPTTVSKYNTFLQLMLIGSTLALPVVTAGAQQGGVGVLQGVDLHQAMTYFQWLVAGTTAWSGLSYAFLKDAVTFLGSNEELKAKQGARGRAIIGVTFGSLVAAAVWFAVNDEKKQAEEQEGGRPDF
ncbi:hypothetical protein B0A55_01642 [Friedmanniomyces simplex]|uniref:Global transcription regulator sge1 n=1 Tax=Friedmanniomyces simplex TaxID=329884 RepID=A0A4U0XWU5_9PEZI|nr:hypothetical protein B0A55_01642 [Friedmanniomyces simplex]